MNDPADLTCPTCDRTFPAGADEPWRCRCGSPLELRDHPFVSGGDGPPVDLDAWWHRRSVEASETPSQRVTLGEGCTPLVAAPSWDCTFKLEYVSPTGSFKDRGAATTLSRAAALGVEHVIEDSSGNAGAAIATYAARAGIDATIYVPASASANKVAAIERVGATIVRIDGSRQAVTDACIEAVESGDGWYASHAWNPTFYAGTMTFAFDLLAQRDGRVPDAIVAPVGHGTLFLGAYRGFRALFDAGVIDRMPRMLGAQAAGCAPIVDRINSRSAGGGGVSDGGHIATGIQIVEPVRAEAIVAAVEETDGDAIAVADGAVERELERLHHRGFYVEPTSAVAPAALRAYRERGVLAPGADVVVPLTGSGLKVASRS